MSILNAENDQSIAQFSMDSHTLVETAALSLKSMAEQRRGVAEKVSQVVSNLAAKNAALQRLLVETERRNGELSAENAALLKSRQNLSESHRRLYACFINLLKSVEDHAAGAVSVEQRIESTIQASDFSVDLGSELDLVSARMTSFLESFGAEAALSNHKVSNSY